MRIDLCRWRDFQHYKRRHAPWIRLYVRLLDDPQYRDLPSQVRCLLSDLWLMGTANLDGSIVTSLPDLAWRLRQDASRVLANLRHLASVRDSEGNPKWLTVSPESELGESASNVLAGRKQVAIPETEAEAEAEAEKKKKNRSTSTTWLTPFLDAWRSAFGGTMPAPGRFGRALSPLYREHSPDEMVARFRHYLSQSNGKASVEHFAQTYGMWDPAGGSSIGHDDDDFFTADRE